MVPVDLLTRCANGYLQSKVVDDHRMSWLGFEEDCIITACAEGHIRIWMRPSDVVNGSQVALC